MDEFYIKWLIETLEKRNEIEQMKLEQDREIFEINKKLVDDSVKTGADVKVILGLFYDMITKMNEHIKILSTDYICLNKMICNRKGNVDSRKEKNYESNN